MDPEIHDGLMSYDFYKKLNESKIVYLSMKQSDALHLINYLPMRYRFAHHSWAWIWFLSIPGAFIAGWFWGWWFIPLILFFSNCIRGAIKQSCAEFVLEHANENRQFYEALVEKNLLRYVDDKDKPYDMRILEKAVMMDDPPKEASES